MSVYLVQPEELLGTNRYKIGCSKSKTMKRIKSYKKNSKVLEFRSVSNPFAIEKQLKCVFNAEFKRIAGNEYYSGSIKLMKKEFNRIIYENVLEEELNEELKRKEQLDEELKRKKLDELNEVKEQLDELNEMLDEINEAKERLDEKLKEVNKIKEKLDNKYNKIVYRIDEESENESESEPEDNSADYALYIRKYLPYCIILFKGYHYIKNRDYQCIDVENYNLNKSKYIDTIYTYNDANNPAENEKYMKMAINKYKLMTLNSVCKNMNDKTAALLGL